MLLLSRCCAGLTLAAAVLLAGPAAAEPSFDCGQAALPIELTLCSNAALGDLEGEMTRLFEQRLAEASPRSADRLRRDMGRWLARLTKDCGVPRSGAFSAAEMERAAPCLARKYREQIAALQPAQDMPATATAEAAPEPAAAADPVADPAADVDPAAGPEPAPGPELVTEPEPVSEPEPVTGPELATTAAPAAPPEQGASSYAWQAVNYGGGLVAVIARIDGGGDYATASVYCDAQYPERVPVFLYRLASPVPDAAEVARVNENVQRARLVVDGKTIQTVGREELGTRFSGLQLLADGTLAYMVLIDPDVLESILHGQRLQALLELPEGEGGVYAAETFPLRNSRKAIEAAMQRCVTLSGVNPPA